MNNNYIERIYISIFSRKKIFFYAFFLIFKKNNKNIKFSSGKKAGIKGEIEIYKRLFDSYKKQKDNETQIKNDFKASEMWLKLLNSNYKELIDSYKEDNFSKFVIILFSVILIEHLLVAESVIVVQNYNCKLPPESI